MSKKGGISHINYKETKGLKISAGEIVKAGTILTREGGKWKAGINTAGINTIYALRRGKVYFTRRKPAPRAKKVYSFINIEEAK